MCKVSLKMSRLVLQGLMPRNSRIRSWSEDQALFRRSCAYVAQSDACCPTLTAGYSAWEILPCLSFDVWSVNMPMLKHCYLVPVVFCYFNFFVITRSCHLQVKETLLFAASLYQGSFWIVLGRWICRICRECEFRRSRGLECTTRPRLALQTGSFMGHFKAAFCLLIFVDSLRSRCNTSSNIVQTINWVKNSSFTQSWHMFLHNILVFWVSSCVITKLKVQNLLQQVGLDSCQHVKVHKRRVSRLSWKWKRFGKTWFIMVHQHFLMVGSNSFGDASVETPSS